jgi:hypothetical protein
LADLRALGKEEHITQHDCIQGWSGVAEWGGLPMHKLFELVRPLPSARYVVFHSYGPGEKGGKYYYRYCKQQADHFQTYRLFWGLSNGDGPGDSPQRDSYRTRGPHDPIDGTAQLTATLAAVAHAPAKVMENLEKAERDRTLGARGRYGFSPVNLDHHWVGLDMVGIDAGAAVLALDNYLMNNRVRRVFHALPCVRRGLERLGFTSVEKVAPPTTVEHDP